MLFAISTLFSCEENDPLSELGKVTSEKAPFVTIANMQALYPAEDSILYNVFYWTIDDDIDKLALLKGETVLLKGSLTVDDGAGPVTVEIDTIFEAELVQEGADLAHDRLDYETARNAYNKAMIYEIPSAFQLIKIEDPTAEAFVKVDEHAYAPAVKSTILNALKNKGVVVTWENLPGITDEVALAVESTLSFQMRVYNKKGVYNDSPVRNVKVGALEE